MSLQVTDLFLVGSALELVGSLLLARGIVLIRWGRLVAPGLDGIEFGSSSRDTAGRIRSWVDAAWGVTGLLLGFASQAAAYLVDLDHQVTLHTGAADLWGGAVLAASAALLLLLSYLLLRRTACCVVARQVALSAYKGDGWTAERERYATQVGIHLGFELQPGEPSPWGEEATDADWRPYLRRALHVNVTG